MRKRKLSQETIDGLFTAERWDSTFNPRVAALSPGMLGLRAVPVLRAAVPTEFVKVQVKGENRTSLQTTIGNWNLTWQSGGAIGNWRTHCDELEEVPEPIRSVLHRCGEEVSVRLIPDGEHSMALAGYLPLYQLLPLGALERHRLPPLGSATWPPMPWTHGEIDHAGPATTIKRRLALAFAEHIWPWLCSQSNLASFSPTEPLRVLAFDLDFWSAHLDQVIERRLRESGRAHYRNEEDARIAAKLAEELRVEPPLFHADAWSGEAEAMEVTAELFRAADSDGRIKAIVEAVRSNRVQDDFSERWSYAREDLERKLYSKRSKCRVRFVELRDTVAVHGADKEIDGNLLWDDLFALVDQADRSVVVCLRSGHTKVGEIADMLGYANHSPVSKKLARIRSRARALLQS